MFARGAHNGAASDGDVGEPAWVVQRNVGASTVSDRDAGVSLGKQMLGSASEPTWHAERMLAAESHEDLPPGLPQTRSGCRWSAHQRKALLAINLSVGARSGPAGGRAPRLGRLWSDDDEAVLELGPAVVCCCASPRRLASGQGVRRIYCESITPAPRRRRTAWR